MPYDPIEREIVDTLTVFAPYAYQRNFSTKQWTLGVKGLIGAIGWRHDYSFCAGGVRKNQDFIIQVLTDIQNILGQPLYHPSRSSFVAPYHFGEWLYDLIWLRYDIDYNKPIDEQTFLR